MSSVYVKAEKEVQKSIRAIVFDHVKGIGPGKEILAMIQDFPPGAETLIVKIIYSITDRGTSASKEVVHVVKEVFDKCPNPQFLISVLPGLSKQELIGYLPHLIDAQSPLKEVINRLVDQSKYSSALSPSELLIQLHLIPAKYKI